MVLISPIYSIPYIFVLSLYILMSLIPQKKTQYLLCGIVFLFFFGLKGFVGWDWYSYYSIYEYDPNIIIEKYEYEPLFGFLMCICKSIGLNYFGFSFISTFIDYILLHLIFNQYLRKYYTWGFFFFIVFSLGYEINAIRNAKSLLLFVYTLKYIYSRNTIKFFILNLIGLGFHASAILFFPLYFILNKEFNRKILLILFVVGNFLFLLQIGISKMILIPMLNVFGEAYSVMITNYLESDNFSMNYGISVGLIERILLFIIIYKYEQKLKSLNKYNAIFINSGYIYLLLMTFCSDFSIFIDRVAALFRYFYWLLLPSVLFVPRLISYRKYILVFYILFSFVRTISSTNLILYDYDNILTGISSYNERKNTWESLYLNIF